MAKGGDFFIESKGHCFLCLNPTLVKILPFVKLDPEADLTLSSLMQYSLGSLSKYLKLDMRKVFHEWENVPPDLLAKVERSNLKVELCQECVNLIQKFSLLHRQLERIQMEVFSALSLIQDKLLEAKRNENFSKLEQLNNSVDTPGDGWFGKLDILKVLREETIVKCSKILKRTSPRVKVWMLTKRKVIQEKLKLKRRSSKNLPSNQEHPNSKEFRSGQKEKETFIKQEGPGESLFEYDDDMDMDSAEDSINDTIPLTSSQENSSFGKDNILAASVDQEPGSKISSKNSWVVITSSLTKKYKCSLCEKTFTQRDFCNQHYETVHLFVRHDCQACKKSFAYVRYLKKHLRTTNCGTKVTLKPKQRKYHICHCEDCGKGFTLKSSLQKHFKEVHLKLLEYACEVCGKRFNRRSNLNNHRRQLHNLINEDKNIK